MNDPQTIIQPQRPPLSHLSEKSGNHRPWGRYILFAILVSVALMAVFWVFNLEPEQAPEIHIESVSESTQRPTSTAVDNAAPEAPFEARSKAGQRKEAEATLDLFFEAQVALKERFDVEQWGEDAYRAANQLATLGDAAFVEENFLQAQAYYADALEAVKELTKNTEKRFTELLNSGTESLDARDAEQAAAIFAEALRMRPSDQAAKAGANRATHLPEVVEKLRQARNHELAERWKAALDTYDEVAAIDPLTKGLKSLRERTNQLQTEAEVREHLSAGFAALDARQYKNARTAFRSVLQLDPDNQVAEGGLQQVAAKSELGVIASKKQSAERAERNEDWAGALSIYESVLEIDPNIEFARSGRNRTQQIVSTVTLLKRIDQSPEKLSNAKLFAEARQIVDDAVKLQLNSSQFKSLLDRVSATVEAYGRPVEVTLLSDNATDVLLSSVGKLGRFESKRFELRPGEYTVIGSQNGCRDVRLSFIVRPGMSPVNIRCNEVLSE